MAHPLDIIPIKGKRSEQVRSLLRLLPEDTFEFASIFCSRLPEHSTNLGQNRLYAQREPQLGKKGVRLAIVDEHLFGDPLNSQFNPVLRIPQGATNVILVPPRIPPIMTCGPYAGATFDYRDASFFFAYELSERARATIIGNIRSGALD